MSKTIPTNGDDVIDSRDIIARKEELEAARDAHATHQADMREELDALEKEFEESDSIPRDKANRKALLGDSIVAWEDANSEEAEELRILTELDSAASGYAPDWIHGTTLIRDTYFEEYAQELAEDIGAIQEDLAWPACHIDWTAAADALKGDYTRVSFDGEDYWVR